MLKKWALIKCVACLSQVAVIKCNKMALCSVDVVNDTHATKIFEPKKCPIFIVFRCSVNGIVASSRVSKFRI